MNDTELRTNRIRTINGILTAAGFLLLAAYHSYLLVQVTEQRPGRSIGILTFLCLALSAVFSLIRSPICGFLRSVLMIAGLGLNFGVKLLNIGAIFNLLDFTKIPTVLNSGIYVFSQIGELFLLSYYLVFLYNQRLNAKRKKVIALMTVVIALYAACFVMECVMILRYRLNIDFSTKATLLSRVCYLVGYVGTAVGLMLPSPVIADPNDPMTRTDDEGFVFPDQTPAPAAPAVGRPLQDSEDFVFPVSAPGKKKSGRRDKKSRPLPKNYDDDDFVI
ncbi:MAG: hypothetical protein IJI19_06975 [Ruminococcus sp.]|nr:hypothetical protein [Ruminococcus sp.]